MNQAILIFKILLALLFIGCSQNPIEKAYSLYQKKDFQKALPLLEVSCLKGDILSCKLTASLYISLKNPSYNRAKAIKALEFACKYGNTPSCSIASTAYSLAKLYPQAFEMLQYGCKGGDAKLCFSLSKEYYKQANFSQSIQLATKSCYGGEKKGCLLAITLLENQQDSQKFWQNIQNLKEKYDLLLQS